MPSFTLQKAFVELSERVTVLENQHRRSEEHPADINSANEQGGVSRRIVIKGSEYYITADGKAYLDEVHANNITGPVTVAHNDTTSKQGGTTNQYYHLTATQHGYASAMNQSVATTATPTFDGLEVSGNIDLGSEYISPDGTDIGLWFTADGYGDYALNMSVDLFMDDGNYIAWDPSGGYIYHNGSNMWISPGTGSLIMHGTTIGSAQWVYLGALDQGLTTTSDVTFNDVTVSADLTVGGVTPTATQWGYLADLDATTWGYIDGMDQDVDTTATVQFVQVGIGTAPDRPLKVTGTSGCLLDSNTAWASGYADHLKNTLVLLDNSAGAGSGNYGPSLAFGAPGSDWIRCAIVTKQGSADTDQVGMVFFVHDSGTVTAAMTQTLELAYDLSATFAGDVNTQALGVTGNITVSGTVDGVDVAAFKTGYDAHVAAYNAHVHNAETLEADGITPDSGDLLITGDLNVVGIGSFTDVGEATVLSVEAGDTTNRYSALKVVQGNGVAYDIAMEFATQGQNIYVGLDGSNGRFTVWEPSGPSAMFQVDQSGHAYVTGNIIVGGSVDGVDVGAHWSLYQSHAAYSDAHHAEAHNHQAETLTHDAVTPDSGTLTLTGDLTVVDGDTTFRMQDNGTQAEIVIDNNDSGDGDANLNLDAGGVGEAQIYFKLAGTTKWRFVAGDSMGSILGMYEDTNYHGYLVHLESDATDNRNRVEVRGTGGIKDNPQDGTELLPTVRLYDTVSDYGSGTATVGEFRGGVEWYSTETSGDLPGVTAAIYDINLSTYNTSHGLAFCVSHNTATPSEVMCLHSDGGLNIAYGGSTISHSQSYALFVDVYDGSGVFIKNTSSADTTLTVRGGEGSDGIIQLLGDESDQDSSDWRIRADYVNTSASRIMLETYSTGSWVAGLFIDNALDLHSQAISTNTTASAANVYIDSTGYQVYRSTSSRRYKDKIVDMPETERIFQLRPVQYRSRKVEREIVKKKPWRNDKGGMNDVDCGEVKLKITNELHPGKHIGLIAEEVAEVFPEAVTRDADGKPDWVQYQHLIAPLIAEVKKLRTRVEELEAV